MISIAQMVKYRRQTEKLVRRAAEARIPTLWGDFTCYVYESLLDGEQHVAMVKGVVAGETDVMVRVHSECLTATCSARCAATAAPSSTAPWPASPKRAWAPSCTSGATRVVASASATRSGRTTCRSRAWTPSRPTWRSACRSTPPASTASVLRSSIDLGITTMRLITNNPSKFGGLDGFGLEITGRVSHPDRPPNAENIGYPDQEGTDGSPDRRRRLMAGTDVRIAMIAQWHSDLVNVATTARHSHLVAVGIAEDAISLITVPGGPSPLVEKVLAMSGDYDAVPALGFVVDGGIYRHEFVAQAILTGFVAVSTETGVPVLSAVLTPQRFDEKDAGDHAFFAEHLGRWAASKSLGPPSRWCRSSVTSAQQVFRRSKEATGVDQKLEGREALVLDGAGLRVWRSCGRFNAAITERLLDGVVRGLAVVRSPTRIVVVEWVPGAFEVPFAPMAMIHSGEFDAVIGLGCVIRGDTSHYDFVAGECARGLQDVGLATGVPVIFGVLTTENRQQAEDRSEGPRPQRRRGGCPHRWWRWRCSPAATCRPTTITITITTARSPPSLTRGRIQAQPGTSARLEPGSPTARTVEGVRPWIYGTIMLIGLASPSIIRRVRVHRGREPCRWR